MLSVQQLRLATRFVAKRWAAIHPYEVQAALNNNCNLRCSYCRCPDIESDTLTGAQWISLIEQFARAGTLRIKFQGGEPTIRSDFGAIAAAAQSAGLITAVTTNGIAIARRPQLLDALDEVIVSIDGVSPHVHDRNRGHGSHALAIRAIDEARARGRRVFVNMVVTNETLDEVEPMLDFCEARRVGFNAQPVMVSIESQDRTAVQLQLSVAAEQRLERRLAAWRRAGRPVMFSSRTYDHAARWPDYRVPTRPSAGPSQCMAGRFYVHITPNGDVHPCWLHQSPFRPKNLITDGFEAALLHAQHHRCGDCFLPYLNERKALFALRPDAVAAWLRRG